MLLDYLPLLQPSEESRAPVLRMVRKGVQQRHRIRIRAVADVKVTTLTATPVGGHLTLGVSGEMATSGSVSVGPLRDAARRQEEAEEIDILLWSVSDDPDILAILLAEYADDI